MLCHSRCLLLPVARVPANDPPITPIEGFRIKVMKPLGIIFNMLSITLCFFLPLLSSVTALPSLDPTEALRTLVCENPSTPSYFDYSVKNRSHRLPLCPLAPLIPRDSSSTIDDYSCSQSKPCSNGERIKLSLQFII